MHILADYQIMHNLRFGAVIRCPHFSTDSINSSHSEPCVSMNPGKSQWSFIFHCCVCTKFLCKYLVSVVNTLVKTGRYWPTFSSFSGASLSVVVTSLCLGAAHGGVFYLQKQKNIAGALAFWMANASELLNFIKQDRDLSRLTLDAQDVLAHLVQMAFK